METGKIKRCMMDAVIASETTERIINPPVLLPHPPTRPRPHHPPLMESLPCLSRRRRKLAGSARRQPRPPGRPDPLIRSRRWKPEVGWSTDGGDPHPSSLHHHRVGEEPGQNQDGGGGGGRLDCRMDEDQSAIIRPRCRGFTLHNMNHGYSSRSFSEIFSSNSCYSISMFLGCLTRTASRRHNSAPPPNPPTLQHSPQSGGLRGFPLPSLLISAMDLQRLKTPSFPIG